MELFGSSLSYLNNGAVMDSQRIRQLLVTHYAEAADGLVDKPPSRLMRGEGTERNYYIFKIDLVGSTGILLAKRKSTYLKLAHVYLSTVDKITQEFGADAAQVEYAGDSVFAYFPEDKADAEHVLAAACLSRFSVDSIGELDETLKSLKLRSKIVLHFAPLVVSKIGPRASSVLTAIGFPIHRVAKIEKEIGAGVGRVTTEFYAKLAKENRNFLSRVTEAPPPQAPTPVALTEYLESLIGGPNPAASGLRLFGLDQPPYVAPRHQPQPVQPPEPKVIGYNINWLGLYRALGLTK